MQKDVAQISEMESIGDSVYNLGRTLNRHRQNCHDVFTDTQLQHMHTMLGLVDGALAEMQKQYLLKLYKLGRRSVTFSIFAIKFTRIQSIKNAKTTSITFINMDCNCGYIGDAYRL